MIPERAGTAGGINAARCAFEKAFGRRTGRFLMLINCCFGCIISVYYQRFVVIMLKVS